MPGNLWFPFSDPLLEDWGVVDRHAFISWENLSTKEANKHGEFYPLTR